MSRRQNRKPTASRWYLLLFLESVQEFKSAKSDICLFGCLASCHFSPLGSFARVHTTPCFPLVENKLEDIVGCM
jgi:hypothetical protein